MANTTIMINSNTRDLLKEFGKKDDTYDDIINKLIEATDKKLFFSEQKKILLNEKFSSVDDL
jgi:hypothetical protein